MSDTTSPTGVGAGGSTAKLTYGQKAVGLTFNPSNNLEVQAVKVAYAAIIDSLNDKIIALLADINKAVNGEQVRLYKIAITEAQSAQMWAVKAITWQY